MLISVLTELFILLCWTIVSVFIVYTAAKTPDEIFSIQIESGSDDNGIFALAVLYILFTTINIILFRIFVNRMFWFDLIITIFNNSITTNILLIALIIIFLTGNSKSLKKFLKNK